MRGPGSGDWLSPGFLLIPLVATRFVTGWLYNASGASVLIAGLFHATHNATVNPTGFAVAVLHLPRGRSSSCSAPSSPWRGWGSPSQTVVA